MSWKDDDFVGGNRGQSYGGPSMEEIAIRVQEKLGRFGRKRIVLIFLFIVIGGWLASGVYAGMQAERHRIAFYSFLRRLQTYEKLFEGKTTILLESDSELLKYFRSPRASGK